MMRWRVALALVGVFVLLGVGATSVSAQSIEDLRKTIDEMRQQLGTQQKQLETQQKHLEQLESKEALQQQKIKIEETVQDAVARQIADLRLTSALAADPGEKTTFKLGPNTKVTLYGHADISVDGFDSGIGSRNNVNDCFDYSCPGGAPGQVHTQHSLAAVSSNSSYLGVRAVHELGDASGLPGWSVVLQFETLLEASSTPSERASLGSRDSFIGLQGPYGAIKIGKSDTPYKKSTARFDPMANTIGDYNSIMGNTGGDIRAEFDARLPHSIWYESPTWNGVSLSALVSPGQNSSKNDDSFAIGEFNCTGSSPRGSGSGGFAAGTTTSLNAGGCTDGAFDTAGSVAATYKQGQLTAIAAYEIHSRVNRTGDEAGAVSGSALADLEAATATPLGPRTVGIATEWAAKAGLGYRLGDTQLYGIFEHMHRNAPVAKLNERTRHGTYVSATQYVGPFWEFSVGWAHAFKTPGDPLRFNPDASPVSSHNQADMAALMAKYRLSQWASLYWVGADLINGAGAHYCLGPSGHGLQDCSRDANNNTIHGANILATSLGLTLDF